MDFEKCYIYQPSEGRLSKRRKIDANETYPSWTLRQKSYSTVCADQTNSIEKVHHELNTSTISSIIDYIKSTSQDASGNRTIPSCLVLAGPNLTSHGAFFNDLSETLKSNADGILVPISSSDSPNLKTTLKNIVAYATAGRQDDSNEEFGSVLSKGRKLLKYDLQILHDWLQGRNVGKVVIALQDSEAFDILLIAELVEIFSYWVKKIPIVLLFGIATSLDDFSERLPSSAGMLLNCRAFDIAKPDVILERAFDATIGSTETPLRLGSTVVEMLVQRQKDYILPANTFADSIKYAYMSHYYANRLSIFLCPRLKLKDVSNEDFEAVRNLPSFQKHVESLLNERQTKLAKDLLESDRALFDHILRHLKIGKNLLSSVAKATRVLFVARNCFSNLPRASQMTFYIKAMSNKLKESHFIRDLSLSLYKATSDILCKVMESLLPLLDCQDSNKVENILKQVRKAEAENSNSSIPLGSARSLGPGALMSTKARKLHLSNQNTTYLNLLEEFKQFIETYLDQNLIDPHGLFLTEILIYDLKSPQREAFMPRPRFALERALSAPYDYLNCDCCSAADDIDTANKLTTVSGTNPPTSVLFNLFTESGALINLADLWTAFKAVVANEIKNETLMMSLFQRSLAELRYLGYIKPSRKKADHIAKIAWKGL